jgi:hypothetical protein
MNGVPEPEYASQRSDGVVPIVTVFSEVDRTTGK